MSIASLQNDMKNYASQNSDVVFEKVRDGYYFVKAFGNVGVVETDEGIVVIDSTLSTAQAEGILSKIRAVTNQPIKYLIYTHGHGDHVGGARVFKNEGAQIIAQRNVIARLERYKELNNYHYIINERQFATSFQMSNLWDEVLFPDIVYDQEYVITLGGKTFHLIHGKGETDDATVIHIPEDDVVFTGDFIIRSFPNVGNPAKDIRFAKEWALMMEKIRSLQPKITFPGHGPYINNPKIFDAHTTAIKESMEFVQERVVSGLNDGKSLEEILEGAKLPSHLEESPYLAQFYGCLDFAIRGTYRRYTGWYDGNPTNLYPEKSRTVAAEINSLIANEEKILNRANELIQINKHRLALYLLDIIIESEGKLCKEAQNVKAEIVAHLSEVDENYMRKNIYHNASNVILKESN
ncbi:alkyl sulfatase dimerization domain-containing protein [Neobacillus sp. FSL H8-0543]|uniref:alkyl sulfatase dimerization domain-containing protein n=1 Tax=Neobacillus sp. FSL H8-0543 TaxID=2954672 RepID=UPI0031588436